jgi:hypothetical protein
MRIIVFDEFEIMGTKALRIVECVACQFWWILGYWCVDYRGSVLPDKDIGQRQAG